MCPDILTMDHTLNYSTSRGLRNLFAYPPVPMRRRGSGQGGNHWIWGWNLNICDRTSSNFSYSKYYLIVSKTQLFNKTSKFNIPFYLNNLQIWQSVSNTVKKYLPIFHNIGRYWEIFCNIGQHLTSSYTMYPCHKSFIHSIRILLFINFLCDSHRHPDTYKHES